jgi:antitoxin component YwqK of YwqJK toxin-antitoxin module
MKSFLILLLFFAFAFTAFGQDVADSGFTNIAEAKNQMVNGVKEGKWIEYYGVKKGIYVIQTNKKHAVAYTLSIYKSGVPHGAHQYYMDGKLMSEYYHAPDKDNYSFRFYYESGKLLAEFPAGSVGTIKYYYENGKLKSDSTMNNNPIIANKYDTRGNLIMTDTTRNGIETGIIKTYYANGKVKAEFPFINDKSNALSKISFDSASIESYDAKKFRKMPYNIFGQANGVLRDYYEGGSLKSETPIYKGKITGTVKQYYANGMLMLETPFSDDTLNGVSRVYNKNGGLASETPYVKGKINGIVKTYYESGRIKSESMYTNGKME